MAAYVLMIKLEDDEDKVVYKFGPNKKHMGIIEFNKKRKTFDIRESVNDGIISDKAYERWAAERIAKIMYKEGGVFPQTTSVEK